MIMQRTEIQPGLTLEEIIAQLENGTVGVAFGSGLAAIDAVVKFLRVRRRNHGGG